MIKLGNIAKYYNRDLHVPFKVYKIITFIYQHFNFLTLLFYEIYRYHLYIFKINVTIFFDNLINHRMLPIYKLINL